MKRNDEWPQLGELAVDPECLRADGVALESLAGRLGVAVDHASIGDAPAGGWREVSRNGQSVQVAAPVDTDAQLWRVAHISVLGTGERIRVHPEVMSLRRSRVERRRGLALRWPAAATSETSADFSIDVVNTGENVWIPDEDSFHVVGTLTEPGETDVAFSWASSATQRAVRLGEGEYARLPVHLNASWDTVRPGEHDLHATLVPLMLRSKPLRVVLSDDLIAGQLKRAERRRPSRPDLGRMLDSEINRFRAQLMAVASLPAIIAVIGRAASHADAVDAIARQLDVDHTAAQSIYESPLHDLSPAGSSEVEQRLLAVEERRRTL